MPYLEVKEDASVDGPRAIFPFFVGCGRSGTTLVRAIFSSHPDLAIPPESHFLAPMLERVDRYKSARGFRADRFLADMYLGRWVDRWGLSHEAMSAVVLDPLSANLAEAVRRVFALYATAVYGKPRYGDKTPRYVSYVKQLAELLPESRFVHIIRDGRDVSLSHQERQWGSTNAVEGALLWKRRVQAGRDAGRVLGSDRYIEIRYEDLIDDPVGTCRTVCDFIELSFDPSMLKYYEQPAQYRPTPPVPGRGGGPHLRLPPTKGLRDWRHQMPIDDVVAFEVVAGELLGELGYERVTEDAPSTVRLKAEATVLLDRARFSARRMSRRAKRKASRIS